MSGDTNLGCLVLHIVGDFLSKRIRQSCIHAASALQTILDSHWRVSLLYIGTFVFESHPTLSGFCLLTHLLGEFTAGFFFGGETCTPDFFRSSMWWFFNTLHPYFWNPCKCSMCRGEASGGGVFPQLLFTSHSYCGELNSRGGWPSTPPSLLQLGAILPSSTAFSNNCNRVCKSKLSAMEICCVGTVCRRVLW